jgi:hypothetical protein
MSKNIHFNKKIHFHKHPFETVFSGKEGTGDKGTKYIPPVLHANVEFPL